MKTMTLFLYCYFNSFLVFSAIIFALRDATGWEPLHYRNKVLSICKNLQRDNYENKKSLYQISADILIFTYMYMYLKISSAFLVNARCKRKR